jgi:hypothetical protein
VEASATQARERSRVAIEGLLVIKDELWAIREELLGE